MTVARFCPSCGAARIEGARFCGGCGADLAAPGVPTAPVSPDTEPQVQPVIEVPAASPPVPDVADIAPPSAAPTAPASSQPASVDRPAWRRPLLLLGLLVFLVIAVGIGVGAVLLLKPSSTPVSAAATPFPGSAGSLAPGASPSPVVPTVNPSGYVGIFSPAGTMQWPRFLAASALLRDGTVLIAGGTSGPNNAGTLTSAEIFDPRTGTSTATGNMLEARAWDTATVLDDGRVLVVGGDTDGSRILGTAEIYDPTSRSWTFTGPVVTPRTAGVTATLLSNGEVLVAGGIGTDNTWLSSAELFDPRTNTWSATGNLRTAREDAVAATLLDGRVLILGGSGHSSTSYVGTTATAEIYDPQTGTFTSTGSMGMPRQGPAVAVLPNGAVLVAGGQGLDGVTATAEIYDPQTGTFTPTGGLGIARAYPASGVLRSGRILVAGGEVGTGSDADSTAFAEIYDPTSGTFARTGSMSVARLAGWATVLNDGRVLIVGGVSVSQGAPLDSLEIYH